MKFVKYFSIFSLFVAKSFGQIPTDWLIQPPTQKASIAIQGKYITLANGLSRRIFYLGENLACIDYQNLSNGQQLLRAVHPEAHISLNGKSYPVGGMEGQKERAYFKKGWEEKLSAGKEDFRFVRYQIQDMKPFLAWTRKTWATNHLQATGKQIDFEYESPLPELKNIGVTVHYQILDGMPLMIKWLSIENK